MKEIKADIWSFLSSSSWIVIPTNGTVKNNGEAVMGRGLALEAKKRFPQLPRLLGTRLAEEGNHCYLFPYLNLITFPVKVEWHESASRWLIQRSCQELLMHKLMFPIYIPHVGCGNGRLFWQTDVRPIFEQELSEEPNLFVVEAP